MDTKKIIISFVTSTVIIGSLYADKVTTDASGLGQLILEKRGNFSFTKTINNLRKVSNGLRDLENVNVPDKEFKQYIINKSKAHKGSELYENAKSNIEDAYDSIENNLNKSTNEKVNSIVALHENNLNTDLKKTNTDIYKKRT